MKLYFIALIGQVRRLSPVVCLLVPFFACGCGKPASEGPNGRPPAAATVRIRAVRASREAFQRQVDLAGTLISPGQARISSEAAGVIRQVLVDLGQEVAAGQILLNLDPRELEIARRRAESQLHQTEAQLGIDGVNIKEPLPDEEIAAVRTALANRDDARAQYERAGLLLKKGLIPQADFDTAQTRVKITEAACQAALENVRGLKALLQDRRAACELAEKKLGDAVIRSPLSGSVGERLVQPGEFIRENTPVFTIVQLHPLKLRTAVQEKYARRIQPGQTARFRVEAFPDALFEGKVINISPSLEQVSRTMMVEVLVDNQDRRLKPGFFAKGVILTGRDEGVLAVPEETISILAGVTAVFVVQSDQRVKQSPVTLGVREGKYREVLAGLDGSELLAASNLNQLATGTPVQQDDAPPAGASTSGAEAHGAAPPQRGGRK